ncbi:MAG: recombinase RecA [Planctomycetes bacterium]|nr:recombinase RecA [Planctomycetota bacterium]
MAKRGKGQGRKGIPAEHENAEARKEALERALEQIETSFGKGAVMRMNEGAVVSVDAIPTGALTLDMALGVGGVPRGRAVEIFGPEASGKTTLALSIIAQAQKRGGSGVFIDAEHAFDPAYARKIGVDVDDLLLSQPMSGEEGLDIADTLIRSNAVDVVVLDSVAALVPQAEIEGEMGDTSVGLQARLMSRALRKLAGIISKTRTTVIFINQLREKIGIMFGNPETTPGGRALKFFSSVRIDVRRIGSIKKGDEHIGNVVRARVVKNKVAPPFRRAEFAIRFDSGIDYIGSVIDLAIEEKLVTKSGSWLSYGKKRLGQGQDQARDALVQDPALLAEIESAVKEHYLPAAVSGSGEVGDDVPAEGE